MRVLKILGILCLIYLAIVVVFESSLILFQPEFEDTFVITTTDEDGRPNNRVLVRNVSEGKLYASVNHWPRAWYYEALENPQVRVSIDGTEGDYVAVPVTGEEHDRVDADNPHGIVFYALVGFAPRRFLRLDPM